MILLLFCLFSIAATPISSLQAVSFARWYGHLMVKKIRKSVKRDKITSSRSQLCAVYIFFTYCLILNSNNPSHPMLAYPPASATKFRSARTWASMAAYSPQVRCIAARVTIVMMTASPVSPP